MYLFRKFLMCVLLVLTCSTSVSAQLPPLTFTPTPPFLSFPPPVLPEAIQDCVDDGVCTGPVSSGLTANTFVDSDLFRRYRYTDSSSGTATQMELLQYAIGGNSARTARIDGTRSTIQSYSGAAWIAMQSEYDLSNNSHTMRLFFDQVSPDDLLFSGSLGAPSPTVDISLTTDALLAGSGSLYFEIEETGQGGSSSLNVSDNAITICVGFGCYSGAEFNLLNAGFSQTGNTAIATFPSFPSSVEGQLLFSSFHGAPEDFSSEPSNPAQEFRSNFLVGVASVPEPSSASLILSLALGLSLRRTRR